ncbi:MAG: hypothetical protein MJK08_10440 [Campylobacterales bacterium]|nr:hypothetical protein [Campylobacterales bacterium]
MYVDEKYLNSNYDDAHVHLKKILKSINENTENAGYNGNELDYFMLLDTVQCINAFCDLNKINQIDTEGIESKNTNEIISLIYSFYQDIVIHSPNPFYSYFEQAKYSFEEEEYQTIQDSLNYLREDIHASKIFGKEHQERLLSKLEALQKELHKKMSTLEKALGQLLSIGTTIGAFGEKSKPMFDRVNETIKSVLRIQQKGDNVTLPENQLGCEAVIEAELIEDSSATISSVDV